MKLSLTSAEGNSVSECENPNDKQFTKFNGSTTEAKVRADSGRGRGESNGNPTGGAQECHLY